MMTKPIRRKFMIPAVLSLFAIFFSLPSFINNLPAGLQKILSSDGMRLGLDLQGGMNLILKVNLTQAVQSQLEQTLTDLRAALKEKRIASGPLETVGSNHLRLQLINPADMASLREILTRDYPNLTLLSSSQNAGQANVVGGYDKALWTIVDSHITTLITAFALFLFGTGPIKGFAVTLSIGVIFNLFTGLYGTRAVYDYLHFTRRIKSLHFVQIIKNSRIDFIGLSKAAFLLSGLLVISGLFAFVQIQRAKANLGVDFAGGAMVQLKAQKPYELAEIRSVLARRNVTDYELQDAPGQNILIVRIKQSQQSVGAAATFHDVLAVLGIFYLLNKEITLPVVAALLTLAGYSLTDTVVVFDRIGENLGKKGKPDLGQVINQSINEVLSRTLITSGIVLMVLIALLLTGGVLLRDFALALTIGVAVGTYSSVFAASPLVYIWPARRRPAAKAAVKPRKSYAQGGK